MLGSCFPSTDIQAKITARVNSYTELDISRLKREVAEIERQTAVVKAAAEQKASQLSSSQTQTKSLEMLRLQAAEEAIEKWNGRLPSIQARPGQTIVIGRDALHGGEVGR